MLRSALYLIYFDQTQLESVDFVVSKPAYVVDFLVDLKNQQFPPIVWPGMNLGAREFGQFLWTLNNLIPLCYSCSIVLLIVNWKLL